MKTSRKKWSRVASNFIALVPSRFIIRQMLANFFWSWILKDSYKVQEKKKKVVLCSRPRQNVKLGTCTLYSCNNGKEMFKEVWASAELFC